MDDTVNKSQLLFGINQGAVFDDIRTEHAKTIADMDLDGYAIGGLAVGEISLTAYILHVMQGTVICIQSTADSILRMPGMRLMTGLLNRDATARPAGAIPEHI